MSNDNSISIYFRIAVTTNVTDLLNPVSEYYKSVWMDAWSHKETICVILTSTRALVSDLEHTNTSRSQF